MENAKVSSIGAEFEFVSERGYYMSTLSDWCYSQYHGYFYYDHSSMQYVYTGFAAPSAASEQGANVEGEGQSVVEGKSEALRATEQLKEDQLEETDRDLVEKGRGEEEEKEKEEVEEEEEEEEIESKDEKKKKRKKKSKDEKKEHHKKKKKKKKKRKMSKSERLERRHKRRRRDLRGSDGDSSDESDGSESDSDDEGRRLSRRSRKKMKAEPRTLTEEENVAIWQAYDHHQRHCETYELLPETELYVDRSTGLLHEFSQKAQCYYTQAQLRLTVVESACLKGFPRYLIGAEGVSFGRDKAVERRIRLVDMEVSKFHCQVYFSREDEDADGQKSPEPEGPSWGSLGRIRRPSTFFIIDHGSQNGTYVNGERLSDPKIPSSPRALAHQDVLKIGGTTFRVHLHLLWPHCCDECAYIGNPLDSLGNEADWQRQSDPLTTEGGPAKLTKADLEAQRKLEQQRLKDLVGVSGREAPEMSGSYLDRAQKRRDDVGIDYSMVEEAKQRLAAQLAAAKAKATPALKEVPATEKPISVDNKGSKMLKALGWKEGEGLGKSKQGRTAPVPATTNPGHLGLGQPKPASTTGLPMQEATRKAFYDMFDKND